MKFFKPSSSKFLAIIYYLVFFALPVYSQTAVTMSLGCSPSFEANSSGAYISSLTLAVKASQSGTVYYIVYNTAVATPPKEKVVAYGEGSEALPAGAVYHGAISISAPDVQYSKKIIDLPPHTTYYTFAVVKNANGISVVSKKVTHIMKPKKGPEYFYTEYLPADYNSSPKKYPLLIFLHGNNEYGNTITSLTSVLKEGPPKEITAGVSFPEFIIISPQSPTNATSGNKLGWEAPKLDTFFEWLKTTYPRIDLDRIYLTGLSMGGFGTWKYAMKYPQKLAAIVPISGGGSTAEAYKLKTMPIWALHDKPDGTATHSNTIGLFNAVKASADSTNLPLKINMTLVENLGPPTACKPVEKHEVWTTAYAPANVTPYPNIECGTIGARNVEETHNTITPGQNVYTWLLQQSRGGGIPVANAGADASITSPASSVTLTGSGSDDGTITSYFWEKLSGGQATISNPNSPTVTLTNLMVGSYVFQLTVTDDTGATDTDQVTVTVNPVNQVGKTFKINFRGSAPNLTSAGWNDFFSSGTTGAKLTELKYTDGGSTTYSVSVSGGFNGANASGSTASNGVYPADVMQTAWFVSTNTASIIISGLNNQKKYTIKFFGSRQETGTPLDRTTEYSWGDTTVRLNASNNYQHTVTIPDITPDAGSIEFTVKDAPGGAAYGYLNAIEVIETAVQASKTINLNFRGTNGPLPPTGWNDFTNFSNGATLTRLKYSDGNSTNYSITVNTGFNGANTSGSTATDGAYPANVMQTAWYVAAGNTGVITISGLDNAKKYTLRFFGSRIETSGGTTNRTTEYAVTNSIVTLNASNNYLNTAQIPLQSPSNGTIQFSVRGAAASSTGYGYLNVLEIIEETGGDASSRIAQTDELELYRPDKNTFSTFPMPFTDRITVTNLEEIQGRVSVTIEDFSGGVYYQKNDYEVAEGAMLEVDLSNVNIPKGLLIMKIQSSSGYSKTTKVLKQ